MKAERIVYKRIGDVELALHVFSPEGHKASDKAPCIVFFFGGGWKGGTPRQFFPHCEHLAGRGMVAISAEYRTAGGHGTSPRECVKDGKSAVRWIRSHADELGVDSRMLAAGGGSAGAHVAAATATLSAFDEDGEDTSVSCRPDALVLFNPVFDNGPGGYGHERVRDYWEAFSPMHNIQRGMPPTLIMLGTKDNLVPVKTAEEFQRRVRNLGGRCELKLYEGQKHGFFNFGNRENYDQTVADMDRFLESLDVLDSATGFYTPDADTPSATVESWDDALPSVFLIGDSISLGYTPLVRERLSGIANVDRPRANCGDTRSGLAYLTPWLGDRTWDVIHFNWGLHDIAYRHPDAEVYGNRDKVNGRIAVPADEYARNLELLVERLIKTGSKLVWASTTYVPDGEAGRFQGDEVTYNAMAADIMRRHEIAVNDLHAVTTGFAPEMFAATGDVHYSDDGKAALADHVAACVRSLL